MREFSQWIRLIHELTQLTGAEELLDGGDERLGIDQLGRGERVGLTDRHPFLDDSLKAVQTNTHLVLKQLTHGADPAITQMIDVIEAGTTNIQLKIDQIIKGGQHILMGEGAHGVWNRETELLIDLVATHSTEVVALGIKETGLQKLLSPAD